VAGKSCQPPSLLDLARRQRLPEGVWWLQRLRDPQDIARHLGAAAFSGGATFVVATPTRYGQHVGLALAEAQMAVTAGLQMVSPRPDVESYVEQDSEGCVLVLEVAGMKRGSPPPRLDGPFPIGGVYELRNGRPRPLLPGKIEEYDRLAGVTPDELARADYCTLDDLDRKALDRIGAAVRVPANQGVLVALHNLGVVTHPSSTGAPTLAAMAALGAASERGAKVPHIEHRAYPFGLAEAASGLTQQAHPLILTGGVLVIEPELRAVLQTFTRGGRLMYRVVLEAIVNAIGHRSYAPAHLDKPIHVEQYVDAVLVKSPGAALERVDMLDEDGPRHRFARNPRLMNLLRLLGLAQSRGLGRELLLRGGDTGLEPARFEAGPDWFGVALELARPKVARVVRARQPTAEESQSAGGESNLDEGGDQPAGSGSEDRGARLLTALKKLGTASAKELAEALGVSRSTISNWLRELIDDGKVRAVGGDGPTSPHRQYEEAPHGG
jgi:predicted HTH transcriptional regulator